MVLRKKPQKTFRRFFARAGAGIPNHGRAVVKPPEKTPPPRVGGGGSVSAGGGRYARPCRGLPDGNAAQQDSWNGA